MSPGSLSLAKLMMMSSAPAKSAEDVKYASKDPFIQSTLFHTISTPICIWSAFFSTSNVISLQVKRFPESCCVLLFAVYAFF